MEHVMEHKNKNQNLRYENALKITYQKESQLSPILSLDTLGKNGIHQIGCVSCKQRFLFPYKINQAKSNISLQVYSHVQIGYKSNKSVWILVDKT